MNQSGTVIVENIVSRQLVTPAGSKNDFAAAAVVEGQLVGAGQQQLVRSSQRRTGGAGYKQQGEAAVVSRCYQDLLQELRRECFRQDPAAMILVLPPAGAG
jgi:hypothetical protein